MTLRLSFVGPVVRLVFLWCLMPVLIFDSTSTFHSTWADQWQKSDKLNRKKVGLAGGKHTAIRDTFVKAIKLAGQTAGNELILAVGHGGALSSDVGNVDLAPNRLMRLARGTIGSRNAKGTEVFYDPFYDFVFPRQNVVPKSDKMNDEDWSKQKNSPNAGGAKFRLARFGIYRSIGDAIKANHINQVVFVTCNIGNATDFIKKIAFDWNVKIKAYKRSLIFQLNSPGTGKARAFLDGDKDGKGTNTVTGETEIPQVDFVTVGPPLSSPAPAGSQLPAPKGKSADASPWVGSDGNVIHPAAPTRIGSAGPAHVVGFLAGQTPDGLPHPLSPAARTLDPIELQRFS